MTVTIVSTARTRPLSGRCLILAILLCSACILPGSPASGSQTDVRQLKKGAFLVATRQLERSVFARTVIFITDYDTSGASGLIINRPTNLRLARLLPELEDIADDSAVLHFGGPVIPRAVFSLIRTPREHAAEHHVIADISLAAGKNALIHMVSKANPDDAVRAYSGYSGWAPGQLESEVAHGDWLVIDADTAIIFDAQPRNLWAELIKRWSGQWL